MNTDSELFNATYLKRVLLHFYNERDNLNWWNDVNRTEAGRSNGRNKLRTYKLFKSDYRTENYVTARLSRSRRSAYVNLELE